MAEQRKLYTFAEFLLMAKEGKVKPRPIGPFETEGDKWNPNAVPDEGDDNANK